MPKSKSPAVPVVRQTPVSDGLELFDALVDSCRAIEALARLLEMAGSNDDLEGDLVAETGSMIGRQARKLHQSLIAFKKYAGA